MTTKTKYFVGQELMHFSSRHTSGKPVTVTRVGRTLFYIKLYGRETPFLQEDGSFHGQPYGYRDYVITPEEADNRAKKAQLVAKLKELGVRSEGYGGRRYSTETLEKLVRVIEESGE